jgi:hypothetical protein
VYPADYSGTPSIHIAYSYSWYIWYRALYF